MALSPESLNSRIDQLHETGGPFAVDDIDTVMGWVWDYGSDNFAALLTDPASRVEIDAIVRWMEAHSDLNTRMSLGVPPVTHLKNMTFADRLKHIHGVLMRRDVILDSLPEERNFSLGQHQITVVPDRSITAIGGAVQFEMYVNPGFPGAYEDRNLLGTVTFDIQESIVRIVEVQRKKAAVHKAIAGRDLKQLRNIMKKERGMMASDQDGIPRPVLEELMILATAKFLQECPLVTGESDIVILHETEIHSHPKDEYTRRVVYERSIGRSLMSMGEEGLRMLHLDTEQMKNFTKYYLRSSDASMRAHNIGNFLTQTWNHESKTELLRELLLLRVKPADRMMHADTWRHLHDDDFVAEVLPYTLDYQTNYAAYIRTLQDVTHSDTGVGRRFAYRQITQLPVWNSLVSE